MNQFLVFKSNKETLAINIDNIDKIIEYKEPNKVPSTTSEEVESILGVFEYNDKVIPLVDLTKKLYGIDFKMDFDTKTIISYLEDGYIALVVDSIVGIKSFKSEEYEENTTEGTHGQQYIKGFIKKGKERENIILIIDIEKLFNLEEIEYLDSSSN